MTGAGVMRWGGALLALAGLLCVVGGTQGVSGQAGATLSLAPPSTNATQGGDMFEVDVNVQNVQNLGAYEIVLTFNADVLEYVSAYDGGFLPSTGRTMTCFGYEASAATFNGWSALRLGCGTNGLISGGQGKAGPNGNGTLATIQFKPKGSGTSDLILEATDESKYYFGAPDPTKPEGATEAGQTGLASVEVCSPCQEQSIPDQRRHGHRAGDGARPVDADGARLDPDTEARRRRDRRGVPADGRSGGRHAQRPSQHPRGRYAGDGHDLGRHRLGQRIGRGRLNHQQWWERERGSVGQRWRLGPGGSGWRPYRRARAAGVGAEPMVGEGGGCLAGAGIGGNRVRPGPQTGPRQVA